MSSVILNSSLVNSVETVNESQPWVKGTTRGAIYAVSSSEQQSLIKELKKKNVSAINKTGAWILEAKKTETNIKKILDDMSWSIKDYMEVASQASQFTLVNLQRKNMIMQMHGCSIIHQVTKKLIKQAATIAKTRVGPQNKYQLGQIAKMENFFLRKWSQKEGVVQADISKAEVASRSLRQAFFSQLACLLRDPQRFQAISIREITKINVEYACRNVKILSDTSSYLQNAVQKVRREALLALNDLHLEDPEKTYRDCQAIVDQANRTMIAFELAYNIEWKSGLCSSGERTNKL